VERVPAPGDTLAEDAASSIRARTGFVPAVAVVLGSGLGASLAIDEEVSLAYRDIAGFPEPTVPGHGGRLALGTVAGARIAAFHGRFHRYEGHSFPVCALPVRVARGLGAGTLVLTAAVGSLDPSLAPGDVVVARDHVNLMGGNPLEGWRFPDGTPAFVDLSEVYDRQMAELAGSKAETLGIRVHPGVYVSVRGPSYETPAEAEFLRRAGGTVVMVGIHLEFLKVDLNPIWYQEVDLVGSHTFGREAWNGPDRHTFDLVIEHFLKGNLTDAGLITHRFALDDYRRAVAAATDKRSGAIKVAFTL